MVLASFAPSNTLREGPCGAWTVADYLEAWIDGSKCGRGGSASKLSSESYSCVYAGGWGREMVPANSLFMMDFPRDICPTDSPVFPRHLSKCCFCIVSPRSLCCAVSGRAGTQFPLALLGSTPANTAHFLKFQFLIPSGCKNS